VELNESISFFVNSKALVYFLANCKQLAK
jgi:hypothetical protein